MVLYDGPAEALETALDIYAKTGRRSDVRDFLFPRIMPKRRPGTPTAA